MRLKASLILLSLLIAEITSCHSQEKDKPGPVQRDRPPIFEERRDERAFMVEYQIRLRGIEDERVLEAMNAVPRHQFMPKLQELAYSDNPVPIDYGQTISQPYIVAYMTELLELEPGDKVLEIGTGSGYQAAVLAEITDKVYTIEIIEGLGEWSRSRFDELGYDTVVSKVGDGYYGWEEHAPFDAIIVTAAAGHVPPPLVKQLKPGGRIIIPVGRPYEIQILTLVLKDKRGRVKTQQLSWVSFVPMTGAVQSQGFKRLE